MSDDAWSERARSFDARAAQYDAVRPGYPETAIDAIIDAGALGPGARALEIGSGTGKATRLFLARGLRVTGLEPGPRMLEVARSTCAGAVGFVETKFEDWPLEPAAFDLVFAAQSFHWVDQRSGYAKAGRALRAGGVLALFWNRPRTVSSPLHRRLAELVAERAPTLDELTPDVLAGVEDSIAARIEATGLFGPAARLRERWCERLSARRYASLLETHSAYATLPIESRRDLLAAVERTVDAADGEIDVHYETVVHLAQRG